MEPFEYEVNPGRVLFGPYTIKKLPDEIRRMSLKAPLLLSTSGHINQAESLTKILSEGGLAAVGIYSNATMHTPSHITEEALCLVQSKSADCVVSIGGGSTVGLGKAISLRTGLPHICIPTTYAGSEMTPILGETWEGKKTTRSDPEILPCLVLYDVKLTMTLSPFLSATSGVNALAHAIEALYAKNRNPVRNLMALEGISALAQSLPEIVANPASQTARERAQYGAWLCAVCLGSSTMALHHKLCHTLGGSIDLPHAETHTIVLPHVLSYNAPAVPDVMEKLARVLPGSEGDAITGLNVLLEQIKVTRSLRDLGMKEDDIDKVAEIAGSGQYPNPRYIDKRMTRELIRRCWAGECARANFSE